MAAPFGARILDEVAAQVQIPPPIACCGAPADKILSIQ